VADAPAPPRAPAVSPHATDPVVLLRLDALERRVVEDATARTLADDAPAARAADATPEGERAPATPSARAARAGWRAFP
jgi:hypothetical protein